MSQKKIGFWKWLWQLSLSLPRVVQEWIKFAKKSWIEEPIFEVLTGIIGTLFIGAPCLFVISDFQFNIGIQIALASVLPFSVLVGLHGVYRCKMEDC